MKKTVLILMAISLVFVSADAKDKKDKKNKNAQEVVVVVPVKVFTNDVDSMSYALGLNVGADFGKNIKGSRENAGDHEGAEICLRRL